jgi:hypothetical protein
MQRICTLKQYKPMKKLILSLLFGFSCWSWADLRYGAFAQSITILPGSIQLPNVASLGTCTSLKKGQLVLLTTNNKAFYCNGTAWQELQTVASNPWLANGTNINNGNTGNVGIGTTNPSQKLEVVGNIETNGKVIRPSSGTANLIPIAYGRVFCNIADDCFFDSGTSNWNLNKLATGHWEIDVTTETLNRDTNTAIVTISDSNNIGFITTTLSNVTGNLEVKTYNTAGTLATRNFSFVIYRSE